MYLLQGMWEHFVLGWPRSLALAGVFFTTELWKPTFSGISFFFLFLFHFFSLNWGRKDWQYGAGLTIQYSIRCTEPDSVIHVHLVILSRIYFGGYYTAEYSWVPCPYIRWSMTLNLFQKLFHSYWCLNSTNGWYPMHIVFLWLTDLLNVIVFRCMHASATGSIHSPF